MWRHSSDWLRRIFLWGCGPAEEGRGESGARQRPEARDIAKMKREEKGWRELMEKRRGTNGFIPARGSDWQMGARPDAIPNAAGGEGGHGAATPGCGKSQVLR